MINWSVAIILKTSINFWTAWQQWWKSQFSTRSSRQYLSSKAISNLSSKVISKRRRCCAKPIKKSRAVNDKSSSVTYFFYPCASHLFGILMWKSVNLMARHRTRSEQITYLWLWKWLNTDCRIVLFTCGDLMTSLDALRHDEVDRTDVNLDGSRHGARYMIDKTDPNYRVVCPIIGELFNRPAPWIIDIPEHSFLRFNFDV